MKKLIFSESGCRGLTLEGKESFIQAYQSLGVFEAQQPIIRVSYEAVNTFGFVADMRRKDWKTSTHWNSKAEETGLYGELAVQRYFDIPAETAMADFIQGLAGDRGYDLLQGSERIDIKSTRGQALKFKFSKTNRHRDKATVYAFVKVEEVGAEVWATILGWSYRHELKPWLREDERSYFVRYETLRREGAIHPIGALKRQKKGGGNQYVQV